MQVPTLGWEDPLEEEMAVHSNILACEIPWTSELPWWLRRQRICLQCGRHEYNPWVRKIPWRRAWQPTLVFLPEKSPWTEEPGGLQSMGSQRVGHDW